MRSHATDRVRRHSLFLTWVRHQELILSLKGKQRKSVPLRPVIAAVFIAVVYGTSPLVPMTALAAQSAVRAVGVSARKFSVSVTSTSEPPYFARSQA